NNADRITSKEYDPVASNHVDLREERKAKAKKSMIDKNEKHKDIVARYDERRKQLKAQMIDPNSTNEQQEEARVGLQKLPRDVSPVRVRNRDSIDGRPRGTLQKFGISRVRLREMAHRGELPGGIKSSW